MHKKQLRELAKEVISLEEECQDIQNINQNLIRMEEIFGSLSQKDLFELMILIEKNQKISWQYKIFMI